MTKLVTQPVINRVEQSENSVELNLTIPSDLAYFEGHFPQAPILAGVVQIHWVLSFIEQYFSLSVANYSSIDALKFQVIISPNYQVNLSLTKINEQKIAFSYSSEHGQHASGKVNY